MRFQIETLFCGVRNFFISCLGAATFQIKIYWFFKHLENFQSYTPVARTEKKPILHCNVGNTPMYQTLCINFTSDFFWEFYLGKFSVSLFWVLFIWFNFMSSPWSIEVFLRRWWHDFLAFWEASTSILVQIFSAYVSFFPDSWSAENAGNSIKRYNEFLQIVFL